MSRRNDTSRCRMCGFIHRDPYQVRQCLLRMESGQHLCPVCHTRYETARGVRYCLDRHDWAGSHEPSDPWKRYHDL